MKVSTNPFASAYAHMAWEVGYRRALLDLAQRCIDKGDASGAQELMRLEAELHAKGTH